MKLSELSKFFEHAKELRARDGDADPEVLIKVSHHGLAGLPAAHFYEFDILPWVSADEKQVFMVANTPINLSKTEIHV